MPFLLNDTDKRVFFPITVKSTFINELVKSLFRYIYPKVSIEALPLKEVIGSKDLASLGQSDMDMLSQFLSLSSEEDCT